MELSFDHQYYRKSTSLKSQLWEQIELSFYHQYYRKSTSLKSQRWEQIELSFYHQYYRKSTSLKSQLWEQMELSFDHQYYRKSTPLKSQLWENVVMYCLKQDSPIHDSYSHDQYANLTVVKQINTSLHKTCRIRLQTLAAVRGDITCD
jgi:hypothetical protein